MRGLDHMEAPSPYTRCGVKGIGEGGAIAPPAAIANAVNDALRPLGVELMQSPITPYRIVEAVLAARAAEKPAGWNPGPFAAQAHAPCRRRLACSARPRHSPTLLP